MPCGGQPFASFFYASSIRQAEPDAYKQIVRGPYQLLACILIVGNHFLLKAAKPAVQRSRWLDMAIPVAAC